MNLIDVLKAYAKKLAEDGQTCRRQIKQLKWISDSAQSEYKSLRLTLAPQNEEQLEMARVVGTPMRAYRKSLRKANTSAEREALWKEKRAIGKKSRCAQLAIKMICGHNYSELEESRHTLPDAKMILSIVHACAGKSEERKLIKKHWSLDSVKTWITEGCAPVLVDGDIRTPLIPVEDFHQLPDPEKYCLPKNHKGWSKKKKPGDPVPQFSAEEQTGEEK